MTDLISREAALACFHDWVDRRGDVHAADEMPEYQRIEALPSVDGWIPCNERLPKDNRQVLVYARSVHFALAKYDEMREADGTYKKQWVTFDAWKPFYKIKEVIAWMPLPEPCKEGRR